jgi:hypothetical protein
MSWCKPIGTLEVKLQALFFITIEVSGQLHIKAFFSRETA